MLFRSRIEWIEGWEVAHFYIRWQETVKGNKANRQWTGAVPIVRIINPLDAQSQIALSESQINIEMTAGLDQVLPF